MQTLSDSHSFARDAGPCRLEVQRAAIEPLRESLLAHPIYEAVDTLARLRTFMGCHAFAVWDFMCLAKRLQRDMTSLGPTWLPPERPALARFINGVVLVEESDVDPDGRPASHFDLYLSAMDEVGAPAASARRFVAELREGSDLESALQAAAVPQCVRVFVRSTLDTAAHGTTAEVLASFLYGREDLIPAMFSRLLPRWAESRSARRFAYYIERHVAVDGDEHGPSAERALVDWIGDDDIVWRAATRAAQLAISARIALWDGVYHELLRSGCRPA